MLSRKPYTTKNAQCPKCGQASEKSTMSNGHFGGEMDMVVVKETEDDGSNKEYWALSFGSDYFKVNYCHKCGYNLSGRKNDAQCLFCADQKISLGIFKDIRLTTVAEIPILGRGNGVKRIKVIECDDFDDEEMFKISYCPICGKRM